MMEVDEDEEVLVDSEDLTLCFNLFRLPPAWSGFAAFSKKVSARLFGPANEQVYVGMSVVPMGWINSVALMQTVVRTLVFGLSQVPEETEVSKLKWFPRRGLCLSCVLGQLRRAAQGEGRVPGGVGRCTVPQTSEVRQHLQRAEPPLNEGKKIVGGSARPPPGRRLWWYPGDLWSLPWQEAQPAGVGGSASWSRRGHGIRATAFCGKAIFSMSFRRPLLAFLEQVVCGYGRSWSRKSPVVTPNPGWDLHGDGVPPPHAHELASSDGHGSQHHRRINDRRRSRSGYAVQTRTWHDQAWWKLLPGVWPGLEKPSVLPLPAGCRVSLCSLECIQQHRDEACKRRDYSIPKFGERFSGPNAPLSHAVARLGCVEVQPPYDLERGDDFFSEEGKNKLDRLEGDPDLVVEHWAPSCRLFSQARGKPVKLPDGRTIPGPQAVRDATHVMGVPWSKITWKGSWGSPTRWRCGGWSAPRAPSVRKGLWPSNTLTIAGCGASPLPRNWSRVSFQYAIGSNCCWGGERVKWYALLNNSEEIHQAVHRPTCPGHDHLRGYEVTLNSDGFPAVCHRGGVWVQAGLVWRLCPGLEAQLVKLGWIEKALVAGRLKKIIRELQQSTQTPERPRYRAGGRAWGCCSGAQHASGVGAPTPPRNGPQNLDPRYRCQTPVGWQWARSSLPCLPVALAWSLGIRLAGGAPHQWRRGWGLQRFAAPPSQRSKQAWDALPQCGRQPRHQRSHKQRAQPVPRNEPDFETDCCAAGGVRPISLDTLDNIALELCRRGFPSTRYEWCLGTFASQGYKGKHYGRIVWQSVGSYGSLGYLTFHWQRPRKWTQQLQSMWMPCTRKAIVWPRQATSCRA